MPFHQLSEYPAQRRARCSIGFLSLPLRNYADSKYGGELFFRAEGIDSYVAMAGRLIRDDSLRRRAGSANEEFARAFFTDQARTTSSCSRHFTAIIEETLVKKRSSHA